MPAVHLCLSVSLFSLLSYGAPLCLFESSFPPSGGGGWLVSVGCLRVHVPSSTKGPELGVVRPTQWRAADARAFLDWLQGVPSLKQASEEAEAPRPSTSWWSALRGPSRCIDGGFFLCFFVFPAAPSSSPGPINPWIKGPDGEAPAMPTARCCASSSSSTIFFRESACGYSIPLRHTHPRDYGEHYHQLSYFRASHYITCMTFLVKRDGQI